MDQQIYAEIDNELKEAVRFAEESPMPKPTDALQDLYASAAGQGFAKGGSL
jgi:TPP-dependent pyruvate/acetoin dehydrogenase alpha subunit